jgi:hypothetical protein
MAERLARGRAGLEEYEQTARSTVRLDGRWGAYPVAEVERSRCL